MTKSRLDATTTAQLVERLVTIALDQDRALLYSEIGKYNRLFRQMRSVETELKQRPGDQRHALLELYDHANAQVRLNAAKATLAVDPEGARRLIEQIASSNQFPQAGDAGMTLNALDRGIFKPT